MWMFVHPIKGDDEWSRCPIHAHQQLYLLGPLAKLGGGWTPAGVNMQRQHCRLKEAQAAQFPTNHLDVRERQSRLVKRFTAVDAQDLPLESVVAVHLRHLLALPACRGVYDKLLLGHNDC